MADHKQCVIMICSADSGQCESVAQQQRKAEEPTMSGGDDKFLGVIWRATQRKGLREVRQVLEKERRGTRGTNRNQGIINVNTK